MGVGGCCVDISDDGRYVAFFHSSADLLPPGEDTNGLVDVLVHNRDVNGDGFDGPDFAVTRVSVSTSGTQGNAAADNPLSMSGDGRHVGFRSLASNLVAGDTNGMVDIFIRDRDTDRDAIFDEAGAVLAYRVSVRSDGGQANGNSGHPMLSDDGRFVVFDSVASNLVDGVSGQNVYMHDRDPDENDLFDEGNGTTTLVSVALCGEAGNGTSNRPAISRDGSLVAFVSSASESGCNCRGVRVS